jgi:hypothetical protein
MYQNLEFWLEKFPSGNPAPNKEGRTKRSAPILKMNIAALKFSRFFLTETGKSGRMAPKLDQSLGSHHFQFRPICCVGRYLLAQHKIMNLPETGADITIL